GGKAGFWGAAAREGAGAGPAALADRAPGLRRDGRSRLPAGPDRGTQRDPGRGEPDRRARPEAAGESADEQRAEPALRRARRRRRRVAPHRSAPTVAAAASTAGRGGAPTPPGGLPRAGCRP